MVETATPLLAQHSQPVCVVHQQPSTRTLSGPRQLRQGRQVAIHAENAVCGDEPRAPPAQHAREPRGIRMRIALQPSPAQQSAVEQGGVTQTILVYLIAAPRQSREHAQVRHIAGGEEQNPWSAHKVGQLFFEGVVGGIMPRNQVRGPTARPMGIRPPFERGNHVRMIGQPEVVVAAEGEQVPPADPGPRPLGAFEHPAFAVEVRAPQAVELGGETVQLRAIQTA